MSSLFPFVQVARPHDDVLEGRLTLDVYAADLWRVYKGDAPLEYIDPVTFFQKTHMTRGLNNLIKVVEDRLKGISGNSTLQIQTPFGGGKTHSLIALYHKAKEWGAKVVVIDGTTFDAKEVRLWEELERQLTGKIERTKGDISCGKEKLIEILSQNEPVLILMDEILAYCVKASGLSLGNSTLLDQTLVFFHELTQAVASSGKSMLVVTLPSSTMEHYGEKGEEIFQKISDIFERTQEIFTPIDEEEISSVIRKRLFQWIDEDKAKMIVNEYVDYLDRENLFSRREDLENYRKKFLNSYPFKPEVIDILYTRWGSYPTFQRTRGVLRLLSQVIYDLKNEKIPFIGLGDFNLKNDGIRRELLTHIGSEYDSVIANDITLETSGAKRVDEEMGASYKPYHLGTKVATCIFMTSFSGKTDSTFKGVNIRDLKIYTSLPDFQSSVIDDVVNRLKEKLFYLSDDGLYFTNKPNLNRLVLTVKENITSREIEEEERKIIERSISKDKNIPIYIFPQFPRDIPDNKNIKIIISKDADENKFKEFIEKVGETPRVYRNTLIFLCPEGSNNVFYDHIKTKLAYEKILKDKSLKLDEKRIEEVKRKYEDLNNKEYEELRRYYRKLYLPDGKIYDLGSVSIGKNTLDKEIIDFLKAKNILLEKLTPKYIEDRYLKEGEVSTKNLLESFYNTPGNPILLNEDVLKNAIKEGVGKEIFYVKRGEEKYDTPTFEEGEVITKEKPEEEPKRPDYVTTEGGGEGHQPTPGSDKVSEGQSGTPGSGVITEIPVKKHKKVRLSFNIRSKGNLSDVLKLLNNLGKYFENINIHIDVKVENGEIKADEYEKIKEGLAQVNADLIEEQIE